MFDLLEKKTKSNLFLLGILAIKVNDLNFIRNKIKKILPTHLIF